MSFTPLTFGLLLQRMVDSADGVVIQDVHGNVEEEHKLPQENVIIQHQSMVGKNVLVFIDILANATDIIAQVHQITFLQLPSLVLMGNFAQIC